MVAPLLETKFYVPRRRRGLVPRPRLSDRLNLGVIPQEVGNSEDPSG